MGAGRKTQTVDVDTKAFGLQDFEARQRNLGLSQLKGAIFGCNHETLNECINNGMFGLPRAHWCYVQYVKKGFPLFLFNYSNRQLHGVFEATCDADWEIDPTGWCKPGQKYTNYPCQVQVKRISSPSPLDYNEYKERLTNCVADDGQGNLHLRFELRMAEVKGLIEAFSKKPGGSSVRSVAARPTPSGSSAGSSSLRSTAVPAASGYAAASRPAAPQGAAGRSAASRSTPAASETLSAAPSVASVGATSTGNEVGEDGWQTAGSKKGAQSWSKVLSENRPTSRPEADRQPSQPSTSSQAPASRGWEGLAEAELGSEDARPQPKASPSRSSPQRAQQEYAHTNGHAPHSAAQPQPAPAADSYQEPHAAAQPELDPQAAEASTADQDAESDHQVFVAVHSALARVDQGSADALWNALHTLSFRLVQQKTDMTRFVQLADSLQAENQKLEGQVASLTAQLASTSMAQQAVPSDSQHEGATASGSGQARPGSASNQVLYLLGGLNDLASECTSSVDAYSAANATWHSDYLQLPVANGWGSAAALDQNLYLLGGNDTREEPASSQALVWMPSQPQESGDCWYMFPTMGTKRGSLCTAVLSSCIYAIGGTAAKDNPVEGGILDSCEMIDVNQPQWYEIGKTKYPRMSAGSAVAGGCLYLAGGHNLDMYHDTMERYDPRAGRWKLVGDRSMLSVRSGPAVCASADGNSILVAGGLLGETSTASVDIYDVRTETWRNDIAEMNLPRSFACGALLNGTWHVVGGDTRPYADLGYDKVVESYNEASNTWQLESWASTGALPTGHPFAAHCVLEGP